MRYSPGRFDECMLFSDLGFCQHIESTFDSLQSSLLDETAQIVAWDALGCQVRWTEYPYLVREVRTSLDQHGIPPHIEHMLTVLARYEEAPNGQLALEVGIAVTEARSDDPRMLVGTTPGGTSAMLPQLCYRRLPRILDSEEIDRQRLGPADSRIIAEEGFTALEEWSAYHQQPLTGQPWIIFWVDPDDQEDVPVTEPVVRFEVHQLLESSAGLNRRNAFNRAIQLLESRPTLASPPASSALDC